MRTEQRNNTEAIRKEIQVVHGILQLERVQHQKYKTHLEQQPQQEK